MAAPANPAASSSAADDLATLADSLQKDIFLYVGEVNRRGYSVISAKLKRRQRPGALLILATSGGDAHAGFRIARALQHVYDEFTVMIPGYCKSAGTLVCIGASELIIGDRGELGPLDVQVRKRDELIDFGSGLDSNEALSFLQAQTLDAFKSYLIELTVHAGLGTKMASEIACRLTSGLYSPLISQMDPVKLGELSRQTQIAMAYGERLDAKAKNLKSAALRRLVAEYPAHGFVIDRKEAKELFEKVRAPAAIEEPLYDLMHKWAGASEIGNDPPKIVVLGARPEKESQDDQQSNEVATAPNAGSDGTGQPAVDGGGGNADQGPGDAANEAAAAA